MKINPYDLVKLKINQEWFRVLDVIESDGETIAVIAENRDKVEFKFNISQIAEVDYKDSEFIV